MNVAFAVILKTEYQSIVFPVFSIGEIKVWNWKFDTFFRLLNSLNDFLYPVLAASDIEYLRE